MVTFQVTHLATRPLVWSGRQALLAGVPGPFPHICPDRTGDSDQCTEGLSRTGRGPYRPAVERAGALHTKLPEGGTQHGLSLSCSSGQWDRQGLPPGMGTKFPISKGLVSVISQAPRLFPGWGSRWSVGPTTVKLAHSLDRG